MTNKNNNLGDEYQFPEEEYVNLGTEEEELRVGSQNSSPSGEGANEEGLSAKTASKKGKDGHFKVPAGGLFRQFPFLANKRVVLVLVVALAALIGFKIMHPKKQVQIIKEAQQAPQVASTSSIPAEAQQTMQQQQQDLVLEKLSHLSQDSQNNEGSVRSLSREVDNLKQALNQANADNNQLKTAMWVLADQVQGLSEELKKATAAKKTGRLLPPSPQVVYHLRAVLPNRAWIAGSDGDSNSVIVGSKIQGYGTVQAIDEEEGKVLTSSGKVITYNEDGN